MEFNPPPSPHLFSPGQRVPQTGIYAAMHAAKPGGEPCSAAHHVQCEGGDAFPGCSRCGEVRFHLATLAYHAHDCLAAAEHPLFKAVEASGETFE